MWMVPTARHSDEQLMSPWSNFTHPFLDARNQLGEEGLSVREQRCDRRDETCPSHVEDDLLGRSRRALQVWHIVAQRHR
jgi:hypothetical protein